MFKKVFALIMSMLMAITIFTPTIGATQIKANDVETYAVITDPVRRTFTGNQYENVSFNGESQTVKVTVKLTYTTQVINGTTNYSSVSASFVQNTAVGSFKVTSAGTPNVTIYSASKTAYVTGEAYIIYNRGDYVNYIVKTISYSIKFDI